MRVAILSRCLILRPPPVVRPVIAPRTHDPEFWSLLRSFFVYFSRVPNVIRLIKADLDHILNIVIDF